MKRTGEGAGPVFESDEEQVASLLRLVHTIEPPAAPDAARQARVRSAVEREWYAAREQLGRQHAGTSQARLAQEEESRDSTLVLGRLLSPGEMEVRSWASGGLVLEEFEGLLLHLHPDREKAGERYEAFRAKLVRFFEWRGCRCPEDLADKTIDRVGRRMHEGMKIQAADPFPLFIGVAHLVLREVWRQYQREQQLHGEPPLITQPEVEPLEDRRLECVKRCLERLPQEDQRLILRYHVEENRIRARRELADDLGLRMNALRIRVHRLRQELKACVEQCLAKRP